MNKELCDKLNQEIKEKGLAYAKASTELGELSYEKQKTESRAYLDVSNEVLETGKPKYSNEKLRDCAMVLKLAEDKAFQDLDKKALELKNSLNVLGVEKAYLENQLEIEMSQE